jgi:hypothetical protein
LCRPVARRPGTILDFGFQILDWEDVETASQFKSKIQNLKSKIGRKPLD